MGEIVTAGNENSHVTVKKIGPYISIRDRDDTDYGYDHMILLNRANATRLRDRLTEALGE